MIRSKLTLLIFLFVFIFCAGVLVNSADASDNSSYVDPLCIKKGTSGQCNVGTNTGNHQTWRAEYDVHLDGHGGAGGSGGIGSFHICLSPNTSMWAAGSSCWTIANNVDVGDSYRDFSGSRDIGGNWTSGLGFGLVEMYANDADWNSGRVTFRGRRVSIDRFDPPNRLSLGAATSFSRDTSYGTYDQDVYLFVGGPASIGNQPDLPEDGTVNLTGTGIGRIYLTLRASGPSSSGLLSLEEDREIDVVDGTCGDGIIQSSRGETCDNGGNNGTCAQGRSCNNISCRANDCTSPANCGNGVVESGEQCDSGANNGGCPRDCSNACTVNNCGNAPYCSISFNPSNVQNPNDPTTASWNSVGDADGILQYSCNALDDNAVLASGNIGAVGSLPVNPPEAARCTLTAVNGGGTTTCNAIVTVGSPPTCTLSFTPNTTWPPGSPVLATWTSAGDTDGYLWFSCRDTIGFGPWGTGDIAPGIYSMPITNGSAWVNPGETQECGIEAVNFVGPFQCFATVSLQQPGTIVVNSNIPTTWNTSGAGNCSGSGLTGTCTNMPVGAYTIGGYPDTIYYSGSTWNLSSITPANVQNLPNGGTITFNLNYVSLPPTAYLSANGSIDPITVPVGSSPTLNWSSSNALSCSASGNWLGAKALNGSEAVGPLAAPGNYTYTITCQGNAAPDASATVQVNVVSGPTIDNITISSPLVRPNGSSQYDITVIASDNAGGGSITHSYALINFQGANAGNHRGYLTWYYQPYAPWAAEKNYQLCAGGGSAAIQQNPPNDVYGHQYTNLISCSTSVVGNTRTTVFRVTFDPLFTTPTANNDISGYAYDLNGIAAGWINFDINFGLTINNAQFISQNIPSLTMVTGSTQNVSVTMRNTGTTTWTTPGGNYRLGSQNPPDNLNWGFLRVDIPPATSVSPGADYTFNFTITAPAAPGSYNFQWRMVEELIEWFGESTQNVVIIVGDPATLTANPAMIQTGGTVAVTWTNVLAPTTRDWIGIYTPGSPNANFLDWIYTSSCTQVAGAGTPQNGTCNFVVNQPPGNYEFRLFPNNVANPVLAVSNLLTVNPPEPSISNITVSVNNDNYCAVGPHAQVSWTYVPVGFPPQSNQAAYEVVINGGGDLNTTPDAAVTGLNPANINPEWRGVGGAGTSAGPSSGCNSGNPDANPQATCQMTWNTGYTAWVRVQNGYGAWSPWVRMSSYTNGSSTSSVNQWTTPIQAFPNPSFTITPPNPSVGSPVTFTDTTVFQGAATPRSWLWDFNYPSGPTQLITAPPSTDGDASYSYSGLGNYDVRLTATDNLGQSCSVNSAISIQQALPRWREVAPR